MINQDDQDRHDAILRIASHLNVQAARLEHGEEASVAARTMRTLDEMLARHLRDDTGEEAVRDEPDGLKAAWSQYVEFWTEDRISSQPRDFGQITQAMLDAVMQRIHAQADLTGTPRLN